mgnify:CR=1 FL=1
MSLGPGPWRGWGSRDVPVCLEAGYRLTQVDVAGGGHWSLDEGNSAKGIGTPLAEAWAMDFEFLKDRYDFELTRKDELTSALTLPVGVLYFLEHGG